MDRRDLLRNHQADHGHPGKRAYTLLEVLVVAGMIALLASILLPVLARAHKQALRITCAAHARAFGNALNLYRSASGYYPRVAGPPRDVLWSNIGARVAELLARGGLGDPRMLYCPISLQDDPWALPPFLQVCDKDGKTVIEYWKTGQTSYLYLSGVTSAFQDSGGFPTFDPGTESPDVKGAGRAVLIGDRTVELAPGMKNMPRSNHGKQGGWFYFAAGNAEWRDWPRLTAHPTVRYLWYWPRTAKEGRGMASASPP